jgi:hypothetical protein
MRNNPEDTILHSHRRENLESYNKVLISTGCYVGYPVKYAIACLGEVSALTNQLKNVVFWDVTSRGSCKNQRFGGTYRLHHQGDKNR